MSSIARRDLAAARRRRRWRPGLAVLAVAAGTVATVAGCSTKGTPYATPTSSPSASASSAATAPTAGAMPTGPMSPLPDATGQLTGTNLATVLLPAADFPAGYTTSASDAVNSGGSLKPGPAQYPIATVSCSNFVQHLGAQGFGETAMASDSVVGANQAYDQAIYQFSSASAAAAFVAGISPLAGRCPSFSEPVNGSTATMRMKAAAGDSVAGRPTVGLLQTAAVSGTALTLETEFLASGVDVFVVSAVGFGKGAPSDPAKETIIDNLMKRQAAASVLGG
ncbi:MAG TPA: hypothetical protein VH021_24825 [Trebonia sp.]|nr:hypothetical protein [Trebonia sp.]